MASSPRAQARTSCHRCHRRKKKCDRVLPQCYACQSAGFTCSFLDDSNHQVGTYPIPFVRGLEEKIQDLEKQLATATELVRELESKLASLSNAPQHEIIPVAPYVATVPENTAIDEAAIYSSALPELGTDSQLDVSWAFPGPPISPSFVDELQQLLLEATAERHLGFSSGLSFAKLTQSVLRRLSPDKADFVFGINPEGDLQPQQDSNHTSENSNNSNLSRLGGPVSCVPILFGAFPMSQVLESDEVLSPLSLPDEDHMKRVVAFYFAHSHTLYPFVNQSEFLSVVKQIYADPESPSAQSPLWLFRLWMILAVGSTAYASVTLNEESESIVYYNKAMTYFESAIEFGDMAALEVIMLQVSYSFFNQLGPNTWILVGLAARMAVGIGLHTAHSYDNSPTDVAEQRKRVFFSIYMMDRVVSTALGRPFALHDDDIDVSAFIDVDDEAMDSSNIQPRIQLESSLMAIPLHILSLRRLTSKIIKKVYSQGNQNAHKSLEERVEIIRSLHTELIQWRRSTPFPLQGVHPQVPHLSSSWFDLNYYTHLALLYRPSPLLPTLDQSHIKTLATASAMSIREAVNLHRQHRFAYNWLNLLSVYTSTLSLIYAVTTQPDNLADVLRETKAIDDLKLAVEVLDTLSIKFTAAKKIRQMVEEVIHRYQSLCFNQ